MIKLNFIPEEQRVRKKGLFEGGLSALSPEAVLAVVGLCVGILAAAHLVLGIVQISRSAGAAALNREWESLQSERKAVAEAKDKLKEAQARLAIFRPLVVPDILWSRLISDVSASVPKGVWLTQVSFDKGVLSVAGNAVSQKKNEMILVGNFVNALKTRASFAQWFAGVDVNYSIQRRENSTLSVAAFTLKAKLK